jgi:hypothetical protein
MFPSDQPSHERMVIKWLIETADYLRKIDILDAEIGAYFPDYSPFARNWPRYYESTVETNAFSLFWMHQKYINNSVYLNP